ncbi:hypothetical protein [Micromonospora sp. NPDC004551]|uniref:DUF2690 domain-containing protein n=1 Tax=Micromonospora sp. NPDC004551 TaxID=3154284 RepID=UPI0033A7BA1C
MRTRIRTIIATLGVMAAALAAPAPASAAPTSGGMAPSGAGYVSLSTLAASGCGSTCDYRDPNTFKIYYDGTHYATCVEGRPGYDERAIDVDSVWFPGGTIILRYSPFCRTVWTKRTGSVSPTTTSYYTGGGKRTEARGVISGTDWTQMLNDAGLLGQGCGTDGSLSGCTIKY